MTSDEVKLTSVQILSTISKDIIIIICGYLLFTWKTDILLTIVN